MHVGVNSQVLGTGMRHGFSTYFSNILKALRSRYGEHQFMEWSCRTTMAHAVAARHLARRLIEASLYQWAYKQCAAAA